MYPYQYQESPSDSAITGVKYGLLVAACLIIIWWYWATAIYKYSSDRLSELCLIKYQTNPANKTKLTPDTYFKVSSAVLSTDKLTVVATIQIRNKTTQAVVSAEIITFKIVDTCALATFDCITVN